MFYITKAINHCKYLLESRNHKKVKNSPFKNGMVVNIIKLSALQSVM